MWPHWWRFLLVRNGRGHLRIPVVLAPLSLLGAELHHKRPEHRSPSKRYPERHRRAALCDAILPEQHREQAGRLREIAPGLFLIARTPGRGLRARGLNRQPEPTQWQYDTNARLAANSIRKTRRNQFRENRGDLNS